MLITVAFHHKALQIIVKELDVDIFCTNNLPRHHNTLGIDYNRLREIKEDLIWCSISAQGLDYPDVPGYDPMIQAMCGFMDLTGDSDGPPMQCGPPIIDLKAGDEAFTQVIIAMMEREKTKSGKMIDISMAQIAASWLHTFLPMLDMDSPPSELKRSGNEHRQFIPVNAYPTQDGFIYVAIGSDGQWARIVKHPAFLSLDMEKYTTNESRRQNKKQLHNDIGAITQKYSTSDIAKILTEAVIPHSPITPIEKVMELPFIKKELLKTETPDGKTVRLPPPAVNTPYLEKVKGNIPFTPAYGEQSISLLEEAGVPSNEIPSLLEKGVIA